MIRSTAAALALALAPLGAYAQDEHAAGGHSEKTYSRAEAAHAFEHRCQSCHAIPDPRQKLDAAWLDQVNRTAWTATPPGARRALIEYLSSPELERPRTVAQPPRDLSRAEASAPAGFVVTDFGEGELFLRDDDHRRYRLQWKAQETDRRRALRAGSYTLLGYRVVRRDEAGKEWFISTASHGFGKLRVRPGRTSRLAIDAKVHLGVHARRRGLNVNAMAGLQGLPRAGTFGEARKIGLSIYREGKRIPLRYRALCEHGEELASGKLRYG